MKYKGLIKHEEMFKCFSIKEFQIKKRQTFHLMPVKITMIRKQTIKNSLKDAGEMNTYTWWC
jgi:hypothetical protein